MTRVVMPLVLAVFAGGLFSSGAEAAPITVTFAGNVNFSGFPAQVPIGSAFNGSFTFESTTSDSNGNPLIGDYLAISAFSVTFGAGPYNYSASSSPGPISVDVASVIHQFSARLMTPIGPALNFAQPLGGALSLLDSAPYAGLASAALPTSLVLGNFNSKLFTMEFGASCVADDDDYTQCPVAVVSANITSLSVRTPNPPVPEPTTFLLLGAGLVAGVVRRRTKR